MSILTIHKVLNIPKMDTFGHADPYVRVLNPVGDEIFRTQVKKKVSEAVFEERVSIPLHVARVQLVVMDEDLVSDECVGTLFIGAHDVTGGQVTAAVAGKDAASCQVVYSVVAGPRVGDTTSGPLGPLLKKSEMLQHVDLTATGGRAVVGVSWDNAVDVDFVCVAMDGMGLILDVCFFNNMQAVNGALVHSGDKRDGVTGGIDETIAIATDMLPPHAAVLYFCAQCTTAGDFTACGNVQLHLLGQGGSTALAQPTNVAQYLPGGTFAILGAARRAAQGQAAWSFDAEVATYGLPTRTFIEAHSALVASMNIDPVLAKELASAQPKYSLSKGQSMSIPVGLTEVTFGLGWDSNCDVDSSCIGLHRDGSLALKVYYGCLNYQSIVRHSGDNRTGQGSGDDEQIVVNLAQIPMEIVSLFFTVNVFTHGKSFKDVRGEYCRLLDTSTGAQGGAKKQEGRELMRFSSLDAGDWNGVVLVALHRVKHFPQQWRFQAVDLHCAGNTCGELVDECQALQRDVRHDLP